MSLGPLVMFAVGLNAYALLLIYLRSWAYRVPVYRPMVKNFGLSVLPLVLFLAVTAVLVVTVGLTSRTLGIVVGVVGFAVWLLALPNSGYLITELNQNHRREDEDVPLWYDIIAVLTFAMSGVVNTVLGVLAAQITFTLALFGDSNAALRSAPVRAVPVVIIALVSVGIYLGRYLRLNSWDVRSPRRMWTKVREHFDSRAAVANFLLFCLTHTVFLALIYGLIAGPLLAAVADSPDLVDA
ncbi:DUF1361 domain-containing protein [Rhodococcus sp. NPDC127528]|uniref:DUF1361 domain-containing protein n=1 Tax=unclassified Rhodococcus (in: high G+C Gram-positive bacteria) TaxID=192944 RepID=UPI00363983C0